MLWGRAGNRCAACKRELVIDAETGDASIIGEECHIVAQRPDGPRGESDLSAEQRDKYGNLILLCNVDHKIVDDQPGTYTVQRLQAIKAEHEKWVKEKLGFDDQRQYDEEIYAAYVEEWARRIRIDDWIDWASRLISSGQPSLSDDMKLALDDLRSWLLARVWSGRYLELEAAFLSFRLVLRDLCELFGKHAVKHGDVWWTRKLYQIDEWNPELHERLAKQFDDHVDLVEDLSLELTRAANYLCDQVRKCLFRSYRLKEGVVLIQGGPFMNMSFRTYRPEYRGAERTATPYPGLEAFRKLRVSRDFSFGGYN